MKKIIAAASALALTAGLAFGETHETLKARTLQTGVGDISFGAWGRSTFNVGHESNSTKITVDANSTAKNAESEFMKAAMAYEAAKVATDASSLTYVNTAVGMAASSVGAEANNVKNVTLAADSSNFAEYAEAVATYAGYTAALTAYGKGADVPTVLGTAKSVGGQVGDYATKYATAKALVAAIEEKDESSSRNYAGLAPDWSYGSRVGFWIIGRTPDEHFGFDFNLDSDARALFVHKLWDSNESADKVNYNEDGKYAVAIGDQAKIWGLFDNDLFQTKVAFGRMREQELRGTIGDFGQRESGDVKSEDDIFQEIWTATGLFASIKGNEDSPLAGFYMNGAVDFAGTLGGESAADTDSGKSVRLYDAVRDSQFGIGYTLPGLFQIKAQYWGDSISESNYRYEKAKYASARAAGFDMNDYYGRMEFGIDWLGFMGGATSFLDPNLNLSETPNANLIELGLKLPLVSKSELREYDPEKFYNWYACLGTMGVIKQGFIMYKGHVWGGMGTSNLSQYSYGLVSMKANEGADIVMAGADFLAEVCINPFGKQDVFVGLSGNYNITSANASGNMTSGLSVKDLKLNQHKIAAEVYVKKTFAANNFMFAGIAGDFTLQSMEGSVNDVVDLKYDGKASKFYMPIGVELFF
ncbi:hypothetical protein DYE50_07905 [Treponema ruminis]|uniref:Major surface protein n=1 Tax=Treponema ruminis TaxID=744515 RepID=A0A7W8G8S7_9SPIR|nr:hypothetical protein [Treponema ruminis]MBB5225801.1 hypothetical protein [Treponema ruminis]QSI02490.1 hypothetical protein DYE50_07905 [Treponema ruminis]